MKVQSIILLIVSFTILSGCNKAKNEKQDEQIATTDSIENTDIKSISVLFYNTLFLEKYLISCDDIKLSVPDFKQNHVGVLDATIDDSKVLGEIKEQLSTLRPSDKNYLIDARITATIKYKNGKQDQLCIGQMEGNTIFLNGVMQEPNNRLLYLIKNNIGYYPWMIGEGLLNMVELQDQSFLKEPFVSSEYYKTWQKIRSEE